MREGDLLFKFKGPPLKNIIVNGVEMRFNKNGIFQCRPSMGVRILYGISHKSPPGLTLIHSTSKPCIFCGTELLCDSDTVRNVADNLSDNGFFVVCGNKKCLARGPVGDTIVEAFLYWSYYTGKDNG